MFVARVLGLRLLLLTATLATILYISFIASMPHLKSTPKSTLYFGYGSNLWKDQMSKRCPSSLYLGVGRLSGYRWMINDRGYANVVNSSQVGEEVYGLIYSLTSSDEKALDINEGVPYAYTKETLSVDFWPCNSEGRPVDVMSEAEKKDALVYVDRRRTKDDRPKDEYVHRMNMGIKDGVAEGIPQEYVDKTMRRFIPAEGKEGFEEEAKLQASEFRDER